MQFIKITSTDIDSVFRSLGALLCKAIYQVVAWLYELFFTISRVNILSSEEIAPIYQRITMILTIVMVFYITFEFVKYVVQPDTISDKEKGVGNIALKLVIVIVLIAFVPKIFTVAYKLQGKILDTQLISKVILGNTRTTEELGSYGRGFSSDMFAVFYSVNEDACGSNSNVSDCTTALNTVNFNLNRLASVGDLKYLNVNLNETIKINTKLDSEIGSSKKEEVMVIDFQWLFAVIVGVFIAYILVLYCVDAGTRYAQLIFLQIISPIAIMGYLTPKKDNMFNKWVKQCITTYLNLFIRIALIYFVLLICNVLGEAYRSPNSTLFEGLGNISSGIKAFTYIALIMGLLVFANKAPKMLQELFPSSGAAGIGMGLGAKDRYEPATKAFKGVSNTIGTSRRIAGGAAGFVAGGIAGKSLRAALAGAKAGSSKDKKGILNGGIVRRTRSAVAAGGAIREEDNTMIANAPVGTSASRAKFQTGLRGDYWKNKASEQDRQAKIYDVPAASMDAVGKQVDEFKQIKALKQEVESAKSRGASAAEVKTLDGKYKAACQAVRKAIVENGGKLPDSKEITFSYKELNENGFPTGVEHNDISYKFDDGDQAFANPLNTIAQSEYKKAQSSQILRNIEVDIGKKDIHGNSIKTKISDMSIEEYIANIHKVKDAMVAPKTDFEHSKEYEEAHAFAQGASGSKK